MSIEAFQDANVVACAASRTREDAAKRTVALDLIATAELGLWGQVPREFCVTATRKMKSPPSHDDAPDWIERLEAFPCAAVDASIVYQGAENARRFRLSCRDGETIAAAERPGAAIPYSEDFIHGPKYGAVTVINPFKAS